ncbi:DUF4292 domain-containing protein [Belliella kenyensis]|uniref:DUF4292 domain-containing protein n=1 Tax=Belliella kenyensis TaxID=1472724 RepID=A0ABV8EP31_9BACT|nr:DUF4292 domain-containing protein [Belliella kenyensis]MCH7400658.1 DUF4292 domain-containing protein [Belliella kenyensis]MDN3602055.1 DUF4292 domain-containing protein [Belliella kenyensis]
MTRIFLSIFMLAIILLSSCAKKPNLYTSDEVMQEFTPAYFDFNYLSARARIVIEEPNGKTTRGTMSMRAKKDSVIWFSITPGLGIEALRGIVTEDNIRIKDRINGQDINMSFTEFEDRFGLKLSLDLFQNLIYANIPEEFSYRDRLIRIGKAFELTQVRDGVRYHSKVSTTIGKVEELSSNTLNDSGALLASFPIFEEVNGQPFPSKSLIKISFNMEGEMQNSLIHIEMSRIETTDEPLSFPFQF